MARKRAQSSAAIRDSSPTPESPPMPSSPEPTPVAAKAGRPSKLETRAWDIYSRTANIAMSEAHRRDKFHEAIVLASDFERFWQARR